MTATAKPDGGRAERARVGSRAALDALLTEAAVGDGGSRRFLAPKSALKALAGLARRPDRVVGRVGGLGAELARVAAGRSEVEPAKGDRRFTDRGWSDNWLLRRTMQGYLAVGGTVDGLITDADLDWTAERRARFAAGNVLDAVAPSNFPWSNPAVLKEIVDSGGANLVKGGRRFVRDISWPPSMPATVDTSKFGVGDNLAVTPGSVVMRTEVFELIHYRPTTEQVREVPLLFIPPTINKYYVLDLAEGRSLVEYLVGDGLQVFMVSWRNPDADQAHFDLDTYAAAVLEARDAVAEISGYDSVNVAAACSGGLISAALLSHLVQHGRADDVASLTLMVCALDNARAGTTAALTSPEVAAAAVAESARKGYLDGRALAGVFAWLRPNDLVWGYVVNNYLLGKPPPAFDVLYWNQDSVRLSAGLHRDFITLALDNSIVRPGGLTVLGTPVDLGAVTHDNYIVAGKNDHIVPWENAYRSTDLLGGTSRFILSTSGHIQALINPPGPKSRSSYRVAAHEGDVSAESLAHAATQPGSWWPDYLKWLQVRSGELKPAPEGLGSERHRAGARAPGTYVHET